MRQCRFELTYPAVAANSSARLAFVKTPTLIAKRLVNKAMIPSLIFGDVTAYRLTIAPMRRAAALIVLNIATNRTIRPSDVYLMLP